MSQRLFNPTASPASDDEPATPRLESARVVESTPGSPPDPGVSPYQRGDIVAGKYRVDAVLGCGGMAWVLRATHLQLNLTVALKFLRFEATRETVARFFQEGRAAARMSSEAVTRVLDVDRLADGSPFLVMEYLDGFDLQKLVDEPGWLPVTTAVDFAIQACEGLSAVHGAGIVHRDLKPANLFLTRKPTGSVRMKLIDFGISKLSSGTLPMGHERPPDTSPEALMGSPVYMAPEQMRSTKNVDGRADLWSLGVILYELLSGGRSPFEAATLPEVCMRVMRETPEALSLIRADLPLGLEAVVSRCLEKEPSHRFSDALKLAIALAPYASHRGQLLARRLQHPRLDRPAHSPQHEVAAVAPRPSLPRLDPAPTRASLEPPRGPGRAVSRFRDLQSTALLPTPPRAARATVVRPPLRPPPTAPGRAVSRVAYGWYVAWVAMAVWTVAALVWGGSLALQAKTPPVLNGLTSSVANRIPSAVLVVSSTPPEGVGSPIAMEHVYTPEELPVARPASAALPPKPRLEMAGPGAASAHGRAADELGF